MEMTESTIRRPIVSFTMALILGLVTGYIIYLEEGVAITILVCVGVVIIITVLSLYFREKWPLNLTKSFFWGSVAFGVGVFMFCVSYSSIDVRNDTLSIDKVRIEGTIVDVSVKEFKGSFGSENNTSQYKFIVRPEKIYEVAVSVKEGDFDIKGDILITSYEDHGSINKAVGGSIIATGKLAVPEGKRNPNSFNYNLYLKTEGVSTSLEAESAEVIPIKKVGLASILFEKRMDFADKLKSNIGEEAASIIIAILFGDKEGLSEDNIEKFQKNGVIHVLAVSGLHVSMIYGFFVLLFGGIRSKSVAIIVIMLLIAYGGLASFTPSVTRSIIMISIHIFAKLFYYRYDMLTATAFAALLILVENPLEIFSLGFQLSFGAVSLLSIFIEFSGRQSTFEKSREMLPIILIQLSLAPFIVYQFNYFSFTSIIANIPIVFLASIGVPLGIIAFIVGMVSENVFLLLSAPLKIISELIIWINDLFYIDGITSINLISPPIWALIGFYALIAFLFSEGGILMRSRKQWKKVVLAAIVIAMTASTYSLALTDNYKDIKYVFIDVGQGDAIHIKTPSGKNILFDGGGSVNYDVGKKKLMPYLLKNGVNKIDVAVITHMDTDHFAGIISLVYEGIIEKVAIYKGAMTIEEENQVREHAEILYLKSDDKLTLEEGIYIEIFGPDVNLKGEVLSDNKNNNSIVGKLHYNEETLLLTGDIDVEREKELVEKYNLKSNILKVPHHGSKDSSSDEFLNEVDPEVAVIQVGENKYGHPAASVIESLRKKGIIIYRNDLQGAICFYSNGEVEVLSV